MTLHFVSLKQPASIHANAFGANCILNHKREFKSKLTCFTELVIKRALFNHESTESERNICKHFNYNVKMLLKCFEN